MSLNPQRAYPAEDLWQLGPEVQRVLVNLSHLRIAPERLTVIDRHWRTGGLSDVSLAKLDETSATPKDVAVKSLRFMGHQPLSGDRRRQILTFARQLESWRRLQHPNVLPLLGYYLSYTLVGHYISPAMMNGSAIRYIEAKKPGVDQRLRWVRDLTLGLEHMHIQEPPIYHGDLNSWNVLIDSNLNAVLGGFGGSRSLGGDMNDLLTSGPPAGVLRFMSPELILGEDKGRDLASDIWAWGCTVFHILTDIEPFAAANERSSAVVMLALSRGQIPAQPDKLLDLLATGPAPEYASTLRLLHSYLPLCWAIEPGKRPTISLLNRQTLGSLVERALDDPIAKTLQEFVHMLIPPERLQIAEESELGAGTYGEVLLGTLDGSSPSPQDVAVKRLKAVGTRGERIRLAKRLARELNIWAKIDHPNIVKLIGYYLDDKYQSPLLISELMINGNVLSYIRRYNPHIQQRISFARGITAGLACLHRFDPAVCHADLKPENVLIDLQMNAVLCDFGLSSFVSSENSPGLATSTTVKGTQRYMPPEYHLDETGGYTHSLESDVWAWGCTVFEVLTGLVPYAEAPADGLFYLAMVQKKAPGDTTLLLSEYHEGTDNESTVALQFLHSSLPRCWDFNPLKRPSMEIIHSCFESGLPLPLEPQDDSDATTENVGGAEADPPDAVEDLPSDQSQHTEQPTSDDYKRVAIIRTPSPNEYSVANTSHIIKAEAKIGRIGDGEQRSSMGSDPAKLAKTVESGVSNDQSKSTLTSSYYVSALFFTLIASLCANLYLVSQKADPRTLVS